MRGDERRSSPGLGSQGKYFGTPSTILEELSIRFLKHRGLDIRATCPDSIVELLVIFLLLCDSEFYL